MKYKHLFALATLTLGGAALAAEAPGEPLTRAEVRQSVLAALADGTLPRAGETPDKPEPARPSSLTRAQVHAGAVQALAAGTLAHAGPVPPEEEMQQAKPSLATSTLTRTEVKADVLKARFQHALSPAGEGQYPGPLEGQMQHAAATLDPELGLRTVK